MPYKPRERPVKPETLDKREDAKRAIKNVFSRPGGKRQHLERADKGISPGRKP
jgi:hypothetical protein